MVVSGALLSVLASVCWAGGDTPCLAVDEQIKQMVRQVDAGRIASHVHKLVSFGTRNTMSDTESDTRGIGAARRWIRDEFERISRASGRRLAVEMDGYRQEPDGERIVKPVDIVNVVATLPGRQRESAGRVYIVSGHYDSINSDPSDFVHDAPGGNDDATGVAAVLEMARIMAPHEFDATLVFMAVAGEEQGLLGSEHAARQARAKGQDVAAMFTNDIIGGAALNDGTSDRRQVRVFSEGVPMNEIAEQAGLRLRAGGENDSRARQLARYVSRACDAYVPNFDVMMVFRMDRLMRGGDHKPFCLAGYPGIRFTEVYENYDHQHQNVRVEDAVHYGDLPEYVDFDYVANVARVNLSALASLARAPGAPRDVQIVAAKLGQGTHLRWKANVEPDLAGYDILWRETTAPEWQWSQRVGIVTEHWIPLSKDNYFYGVAAVDREGHRSEAVFPAPMKK